MSARDEFEAAVKTLTDDISGLNLDADLETRLNDKYGAESDAFAALEKLCKAGLAEGWLCEREAGGIKFGRALKPGDDTGGFSVDVVEMNDIRGPHHIHTTGEIGMIMPLEGDAKFDGKGRGWYVYPPGSAHYPTVSDGNALVLYLLPGGEIEFTGK